MAGSLITVWKEVPELMSANELAAAGSLSNVLGATTTSGFLQGRTLMKCYLRAFHASLSLSLSHHLPSEQVEVLGSGGWLHHLPVHHVRVAFQLFAVRHLQEPFQPVIV